MADTSNATEIKDKFGLVGITAYIVGIIIGSGIYITSNNIFIKVGSWGACLLVWTIGGVLSILGALSWAELASAYPRQGGTYIYILKELGHFPAFLYILTRVLLLNPVSQAVNALAASRYIQLAFLSCEPEWSSQMLAVCLLLAIFWMQSFHNNIASYTNTFITIVKVVTLLGIFGSAVVYASLNSVTLPPVFKDTTTDPYDWVLAFNGTYWSFSGWQAISAVMEEIKDPKKTFPRAVTAGVGIVTLVYLLTNLSFFIVLTPEQIRDSTFIVTTFASNLSGVSLSVPFSILVCVSLVGSSIAVFLVSGRYMFSAAREGDLPELISLVHHEKNTPVPAQVAHVLLAIICVLSTDKIYLLLNMFVFVSIFFDVLVLVSLFRLKYRTRGVSRDYLTVPAAVPAIYMTFLLTVLVVSFLQGIDVKIVVPFSILLLLSVVYLVVFTYKLIYVDLKRVTVWMCRAFLLVPVQNDKNE